jgi:branched-chain amino acid transport system ATP-binding protein/neutral amino acid transport system ATP-binding protein
MLLEAHDIVAGYGAAYPILQGVGVTLDAGEMVAIIGPNGAGKSTLLKAISGVLKPRDGRVSLNGESIAGLPPREIARRGLVLVPQERNVFGTMSVRENLEIAGYLEGSGAGKRADALLARFPDLAAKRAERARSLSGGQRQTLAMAMALMREPRAMLLDEPTAGLSPAASARLFEIIREIRAQGIGLLMVEQNAASALELADRAYVLVDGRNAVSGRASDLADREDVRLLFLGVSAAPGEAPSLQ